MFYIFFYNFAQLLLSNPFPTIFFLHVITFSIQQERQVFLHRLVGCTPTAFVIGSVYPYSSVSYINNIMGCRADACSWPVNCSTIKKCLYAIKATGLLYTWHLQRYHICQNFGWFFLCRWCTRSEVFSPAPSWPWRNSFCKDPSSPKLPLLF